MITNKEKLETIKEDRKVLSRTYNDELLVIIAEEMITTSKSLT